MSDYSGGATGGDLESQLDGRSLLGFQMDASHLHDVLKAIIKQIQGSGQSTNRRLQQVENAVGDLDRRVGKMEGALGDIGTADDVRNMRDDIGQVRRAVDDMQRQQLPGLVAAADENRQRGTANERAIQALGQQQRPIEQAGQQNARDVDNLGRAVQQLQRENENKPSPERVNQALSDLGNRMNKADRDLGNVSDAVEQMGRQGPDTRWREALEEMNGRMNENFRLVEQGAQAVDGELGKMRTDLANLRAEVNTLDNSTRFKIGKITDDFDEKFRMLLETLRSFESNSEALQDALSTAGRALAQQRQNRQNAAGGTGSNYGGSAHGGGSPGVGSQPPSARDQTSTSTNLRGGYMSTEQQPPGRRGW